MEEGNRMFDIYLRQNSKVLPERINDVQDEDLKKRLLINQHGFLGLNIPLAEAKLLSLTLKAGQVIPVRYRDNPPTIDVDTAFFIAEKFLLEERKSEKYAGLHFTEIKFISPMSSIMYYTFANGVQEWLDAGLHPGARFASVDKLDGHLWTDEEKHELFA
jgi:hypothetical protein